jgi:hypothetical protein
MKGIHLVSITFPDSLPINYTTLKLATYLEVAKESTTYNHQDSGIQNTGIRLVLLYHGSMVDESDPSIFEKITNSLSMLYTTLRLGLPRRGIRNYKISSPVYWHSIHRNYFNLLGPWLKDKWKGSLYF